MALINPSPNIVYDEAAISKAKSLSDRFKGKFPNVQENILKRAISYTTRFSMTTLTRAQVSSAQYTSNKWMVFGESGYVGANDVYGRGERVATAYGRPEYYLNNFELTSFGSVSNAAGAQTAAMFKMEIFEPYSMGLFLQSCQRAALEAGWTNYLDAVFLLRIDFLGWTDQNTSPVSMFQMAFWNDGNFDIESTSRGVLTQRLFPFKFKLAKFKTNETGTTYQIEAFPHGLQASTDTAKTLFHSVSLRGETVEEALIKGDQSLLASLKNKTDMLKKQGQEAEPDEYLIVIDEEGSKLASSKIVTSDKESSRLSGVTIKNETLQNVAFSSKGPTFTFPKNEQNPYDVIKVIEEVILNSEYCIENLKKPDAAGFVDWFKVNLETRYPGKYDTARATEKRQFAYVISSYKVHSSVLSAPGAQHDTTALCKQIVKKYDFYYTGQNDDVLKWDLDFDMSFFQAVLATPPEQSSAEDPARQAAVEKVEVFRSDAKENFDQLFRVTGQARMIRSNDAYKSPQAGASLDTVAVKIAKTFQENLKNSTDTQALKLNIEIVGDPYWLAYSGVYNPNAVPTTSGSMVNTDGTMAVDKSEILMFVGFRTPIDAPAVGSFFEFPNSYSPYSGVYKVLKVVSTIKDGVFTQRLTAYRMMTQTAIDDPNIKAITSDPDLFLYKDNGDAKPPETTVEADAAKPAAEAPAAPPAETGVTAPVPSPPVLDVKSVDPIKDVIKEAGLPVVDDE